MGDVIRMAQIPAPTVADLSTLPLADHPIVILRRPPEAYFIDREAEIAMATQLAKEIRTIRPDAILVIADNGTTLESLDEEQMRAAGWVRA